jgi:hypothetical protein
VNDWNGWSGTENTPEKVVWRARIVLLAGEGLTAEAIAATVGKSLLCPGETSVRVTTLERRQCYDAR